MYRDFRISGIKLYLYFNDKQGRIHVFVGTLFFIYRISLLIISFLRNILVYSLYRKLSVFLFILLVLSVKLNASNPSADHFTISEGLSNNSINAIFQDSRGFLWIGTEDGLNRYDGYAFEVLKSDGDPEFSLAGNCITAIQEDRNGNIWIGTKRRGISVLITQTGKFKHYRHIPGDAASLPENTVTDFYLSPTGEMWIKLETFLVKYNEPDDSFKSYGHFSNVFKRSGNIGNQIIEESDTTFLIGTKDGLNRFSIRTGMFERLHKYENQSVVFQDEVHHIQQISRSNYLIGAESGLYILEPGKQMMPIPASGSYGAKVAVNAISYDIHGNIWLGTSRGLEMYKSGAQRHELFFKSGNGQPLIKGEISVIYSDASDLLWIGTRFNGLYKVNMIPPKFSSLSEENASDLDMRSFNIRSIYEDTKGRLWLGTLTSGIYVLDEERKMVRHYVLNPERYRSLDDAVGSIYEDGKGLIWVGSNTGIYTIDPVSHRVTEFNYVNDVRYATLLKNNPVTVVMGDSIGNMWFGTHFGLYRYNNQKMFSYFSEEGSKTLPTDHITALCLDGVSGVWIGTDDGLAYFENNSGKIIPLNDLQIQSLALDNSGKLWAGTRSGLYSVIRVREDSIIVEASQAIRDEKVPSVIPDGKRRIWVTSSRGITMISPEGTIRDYDIHDGVPPQLFNLGCALNSKDGAIYFGGVGGLCWVYPDSISFNTHRPRIAITDISICNKGDCKEVVIGELSELRIKYKPQLLVNLTFAALEFTQPEKNSYKVMVESYDTEWRPVTTSNSLTLSNLMPGRYKLRIMASNNDFTWNNQPLELPIYITPPLWMTKYAYAFYLLLLIFVIQLFINYRIRHYKRANRSLEEKNIDKHKIEEQREILSRINQNLTDSINYATRIQAAMIPTEKVIRTVIPDAFVYFRPKDLVSGDFYWMHQRDGKIFIAVVDCTGHGVPGAFMSIIGIDLLRSIVSVQKIDDPSQILRKLSVELDQTLRKNDSNLLETDSVNDGMDMSICVIDRKKMEIHFAGAVNGIYIIREDKLEAFKGDRVAIGRIPDGRVPEYTTQIIRATEGAMVYMFSDGYVDQFGGPEYKKFKHLRFRHLLLNIHKLNSDDQKSILHQKMEEWRREGEQIDDILVLGFRV